VSRDDLVLSIGYATQREATAANPNTLHARGVEWQNARFAFRVAELASTPDDTLIQRAANQLGGIKDLNFTVPNAILQEGFQVAGRVAGFPSDVTDYTVVWTPADLAGSSRSEAAKLPDTGATIFINVGCRFYGQGMRSLSSDPTTAPITSANGLLDLQFLMDGSWVRVNGRGVDEEAVRSFAAGLEPFNRMDWRARLGDRLLVDTSSQSAN
jgi:hypothetical protein